MNHLWQSSAFAILAALLAFALRGSPAKVRYWIWLSASLKFLVPLTLLVGLGTLLPHPAARVVTVTGTTPAFAGTSRLKKMFPRRHRTSRFQVVDHAEKVPTQN